jgi:uncharacterized protein (TIGR00106 family)
MIISQLSIAPVGKGTSLSKYVKIVIDCLKSNDILFVTNDMATVIETKNLETLFSAVSKAHQAVIDAGAERVITELKIDDRRDKNVIIGNKIYSVR